MKNNTTLVKKILEKIDEFLFHVYFERPSLAIIFQFLVIVIEYAIFRFIVDNLI